ncbi:hypothetical protein FN846DRAFT_933736 [Sphaerosporella brunnea]|uniref:non-specific serine/threonine protein kinase n=1 Tax=Sphaerosporella brunnea TaxID=1250544 RepID=A0A5J5F662_9PEZI|nr:hypothetical protein FN846DRAFT_933736 [Sphaerosporella brunnea]
MKSTSSASSRKRAREADHPPRPPPQTRSASAAVASRAGIPRRVPSPTAAVPSALTSFSPTANSPPPSSAASFDAPLFSASRASHRLPASAPPVCTPFKANSGSVRLHANNETPSRCPPSNTVRSHMDLLLFDELHGRVRFDSAELWSRFDVDSFRPVCEVASSLGLHDGQRWTAWPHDTSERNVVDFLEDIFEHLRPALPAHLPFFRFILSGAIPLADGDCTRKTDIAFVSTPAAAGDDAAPSWAHVRAVGELKSNPAKSNCDSTIVQLANYAREVFGNQPWRRSVLCFTLCGADFRVWHFDRAGALGSTVINIHAQWQLFLTALFSFATFDATELGFDPTIRVYRDDGKEDTFDSTIAACSAQPSRPFVWIPRSLPADFGGRAACIGPVPDSIAGFNPDSWTKVELQPRSMAPRWAVVSRTAICARAKLWGTSEWTFVVKDQWRAAERDPEGSILRVCGCKVPGLPECLWHGDLVHADGTPISIPSLRPQSRGSTPADPPPPPPPPPCPSIRKVGDTSKHLLHAGATTLLERIHTRMLLTPVGRGLIQFASYTELLLALHAAIEGHRHMYTAHQVLHRDVSVNNIIILPGSGGALIDFDLAVRMTRTAGSGATHRTGTFEFMAYGVLAGAQHTALHDLESFYYVLLWLCIYHQPGGTRRTPTPRHSLFLDPKIQHKDPIVTARRAKGDCARPEVFRNDVLPTLPKEARRLRPLLRRWHQLLFSGVTDQEVDADDDGDDDEDDDVDGHAQNAPPAPQPGPGEETVQRVYREMLAALEQGVAKLEGK